MNRFARITVIAWAALAMPALAHDPGLSAANLQRQGNRLVATLNFAPADATGLNASALEVQVDGQLLAPVEMPALRTLAKDVQMQVRYALPSGHQLTFHSTRLAQLARGHRQYFELTDDQGHTLVSRILSANDDRIEIDLSQMSDAPPALGCVTFFRQGILHILTGFDHLLFITALALAVTSLWDLLKVISAFTLAHTITLTLSVLNTVRLPSHIVEPMIAGSIVFVALTNVFWPERSHGKMRLATAFFFGLFHGLGFAGGLLDAMESLPGISIGLAILAFSLGVEFGHQLIVLPVFGAKKLVPTAPLLRYGSAAISVAGMWYLVAALR